MLNFKPWELCSFAGCDYLSITRNLCASHWKQICRDWELRPLRYKPSVDPIERFWSYVNRSGPVNLKTGSPCWLWLGGTTKQGNHGVFAYRGGQLRAHRFAWEILGNPIPEKGWFHPTANKQGWVLDHDSESRGCHTPSCVNPDHIEAVPKKLNQQRLRGATTANNSSGVRNVYRHTVNGREWDGRWRVQVKCSGTLHYGGIFDSIDEADIVAHKMRARLFEL